MALKLASLGTTTIDLDGGGYLEVLTDISKGTFNKLLEQMPDEVDEKTGMTPIQGTKFAQGLFEVMVKDWSLDVPATVENYLALEVASSLVVDQALVKHFNSLTVGEPEAKKPKTSRSSSAKELAPTTD
jgi:hypothetical protein